MPGIWLTPSRARVMHIGAIFLANGRPAKPKRLLMASSQWRSFLSSGYSFSRLEVSRLHISPRLREPARPSQLSSCTRSIRFLRVCEPSFLLSQSNTWPWSAEHMGRFSVYTRFSRDPRCPSISDIMTIANHAVSRRKPHACSCVAACTFPSSTTRAYNVPTATARSSGERGRAQRLEAALAPR